jgi:DNA-binding transcriptional MerR regulator
MTPIPTKTSIGTVTRSLGLTARALHLYDDLGLVKAERDRLNARCYDERAFEELRFVATLRQGGVGLADIRRLLAVGRRDGKAIRAQAALSCIRDQVAGLRAIEQRLHQAEACLQAHLDATQGAEQEIVRLRRAG